MKVEKREGAIERKVLTAMIVSKQVLSRIAPFWNKDGLFRNKYSNIIGGWCVKYFHRYNDAPGKEIETAYNRWIATKRPDSGDIKLVERFLGVLSDEYGYSSDGLKPDVTLDIASELFNRVKAERLGAEIESDVSHGKTLETVKKIQLFKPIELGLNATINVLQDKEVLREAFEVKEESIIKFKGALGEFFGNTFEPEGFVAFMAPEKSTKSFWLQEIAYLGMEQRKRVAFFECGDMSRRQRIRRFAIRASGRPKRPKTIRYPIHLEPAEDSDIAEAIFEEREFKKALDWKTASKAYDKVMHNRVKSSDPYLKLACHATGTLSVKGIELQLELWQNEGWIPDMIVVDYADILASMQSNDENREQINKTWKGLRSLSQSHHALVVTATQSSAKGYSAKILTRKEFSDDKRKMAHCTAMIGINITSEEKENSQGRLNYVVLRDDEFVVTKCCHYAGCLDVGRVAIKSTF